MNDELGIKFRDEPELALSELRGVRMDEICTFVRGLWLRLGCHQRRT